MMANERRLIDADAFGMYLADVQLANRGWKDDFCDFLDDLIDELNDFPTVDAVMLSDLEAWLYKIAMNNVGEKFDGDFSDAVEEIINRLDGLRVFAEERRTDG